MSDCRNNKNWIDGCEKSKITHQILKNDRINSYMLNPTVCKKCKISLPYNKKNNSFCSKACSASFHSKGKTHSEETKQKISNGVLSSSTFHINNMINRSTNITIDSCVICNSPIINSVNRHRKTCSDKCLSQRLSQIALNNSKLRGNKNKYAEWYISPIAGKVYLESSWEIILAKHLDNLNIKWKRPKDPFIWYNQINKRKRYYPDFYLSDYDIYIDPKNPYLYKCDMEKLQYITSNYDINLLIIINPDNLNMNYISNKFYNYDFELP